MHSANQMPPISNEPTDTERLSQVRILSSIPRSLQETNSEPQACPHANVGDHQTTWMYPSPQMFYNAMQRKGHTPDAGDMDLVVTIHNMVNEQCWVKILEWEKSHGASSSPSPNDSSLSQ